VTVDKIVHAYVANEESYPDRSIVIEEGSVGNWMYVILEGKAKVKKRTSKGMMTLDTLKEGDVFGEMGLFQKGEWFRSASIVAADGELRVGVLDTERLVREYDTLSPQLRGLTSSLIKRLKETTEKVCAIVIASS
jgi:CRP-like cAMP-binding protein